MLCMQRNTVLTETVPKKTARFLRTFKMSSHLSLTTEIQHTRSSCRSSNYPVFLQLSLKIQSINWRRRPHFPQVLLFLRSDRDLSLEVEAQVSTLLILTQLPEQARAHLLRPIFVVLCLGKKTC